MRKTMITLFALIFIFGLNVHAQTLKLNKTEFKPGDTIEVQFTAPENLPENAWIGIIPSSIPHGSESTNDENDLNYQYLEKKTAGTLTFTAPAEIGMYDFRMNDTDDNGKEIASCSFSVGGAAYGSLRLEKNEFKPNEEIKVNYIASNSFSGNAWVGIVPSNIQHGSEAENDQYDLAYQYLNNKTSGTLIFNAPANPGLYDFRMHDTDDNGKEITYITFSVK